MAMILSHTPRLISISSIHPVHPSHGLSRFLAYLSIPWSGIENLANVSGPNLVYLLDITIPVSSAMESPAPLSRFSALRELACTVKVNFDREMQISPDWLPSLEVLKLRGCHSSFFRVLSALR